MAARSSEWNLQSPGWINIDYEQKFRVQEATELDRQLYSYDKNIIFIKIGIPLWTWQYYCGDSSSSCMV